MSEVENEPRNFWATFVASIGKADPGFLDSPELRTTDGRDVNHRTTATALSNALYRISKPLTVVIDDFEEISDPAILETLSLLIGAMPPTIRLVLCSRNTPDLPLSRWRASGRLSEIGVQELRFTDEEAGSYLDPLVAGRIRPSEEAAIVAKADGWIAGLFLASLGVQQAKDPSAFVDGFGGTDGPVADFVVEEVIRHLPTQVTSFLLRTSILTTLSPPICAAVTERPDSSELLGLLAEHGLFAASDDRRQNWAYHSLFREALLGQLTVVSDQAEIAALHRRAATAYEQHGQFREALAHAKSAGDDCLVRTIETHSSAMLQAVPRALDTALSEISDSALSRSAKCRATQLSAAAVAGNLEHLESLAGRENLLGNNALGGPALSLLSYLRGELVDFDRITVPDEGTAGRGLWVAAQGVLATQAERFEKVDGLLRGAIAENDDDLFSTIAVISALSWSQVQAGRLSMGSAFAARALKLADKAGLRWFHGLRWAELAQAQASFDRGRIEEAHHLIGLIDAASIEDRRFETEAHLLLADISSARGDRANTAQRLPAAGTPPTGIVGERIGLANARRCLRDGDIQLAAAWMPAPPSSPGKNPPTFDRLVTTARFLIETDRAGEAAPMLSSIMDNDSVPTRFQIEAIKLRAIAASRLGDASASLLLEGALAAGRTEGLIQTFVDDALAIAAISRHSHEGDQPAGNVRNPLPSEPDLIEPLTDREISVLRLLPTRLTNHEIADELFISVNTVKTHVKAIYRKLEVSNRNAAVDTAVSLRLV